jgi:hypothetical protein
MNQWHHLAFTYDGTTVKMYVNGAEKSSYIPAGGSITQTAGNIYIGKPEFANHSFTGSIDEVAIWDNALPGADILKHYQNGLLGLGYILAPTVATDSLTNITLTSAVTGGNITSDGGSEVTARGVCWNTTGNPTTADFKTEDGTGTGVFTSTLTGLSAGTTYYVRAYSVNMIGTSYGDEISFTTTSYFTDINAGLENVDQGSAAWGDYDNDGDLDLILSGGTDSGSITKIYRNDNGIFIDINAGLTGSEIGSADWGDFDNDGDLDILLTGRDGTGSPFSKIYRNDNGVFTDISADLTAVEWSSASWGDYDNDGDLDILLTGRNGSGISISKIYRNYNGTFIDINAGLTGVSHSSAAWGDYNNDGCLDILLTGYTGTDWISKIYRNEGNEVFTDINAGLIGVEIGSADWGDYDTDGDLDILLTGYSSSSGRISKIYRNDSGVFKDIKAGLTGVEFSSTAWGDYDNDGDLDILLTGYSTSFGRITKIYRNDNGVFTDIYADLTGVDYSSVVWGDYDNDGDLDIVVTGSIGFGASSKISKIYRNNCTVPNTIPNSPSNLAFDQDANGLHFSFDTATDAETPSAGLSYNIDIDIGDGTIKTASSDLTTGRRRLSGMGNIQQNTSYTLHAQAPPETIPQQLFDMIWKVQAVDNCFAGSAFATKNDIVMTRDLITVPKETMVATDALTWEYYMPADSISGYTLQFSGDSLFTECFEAFMPKSKENKAVYIGIDLNTLGVTDSLENNERYFWRVKPEHVSSIENPTGFKKVPDSFIYDPIYSAPSPVSILVEGNYITLQWGTGKEGEKTMLYNVYSSDDNPNAVFPAGWTLVNSNLNQLCNQFVCEEEVLLRDCGRYSKVNTTGRYFSCCLSFQLPF